MVISNEKTVSKITIVKIEFPAFSLIVLSLKIEGMEQNRF
jgi:hypothetical protein